MAPDAGGVAASRLLATAGAGDRPDRVGADPHGHGRPHGRDADGNVLRAAVRRLHERARRHGRRPRCRVVRRLVAVRSDDRARAVRRGRDRGGARARSHPAAAPAHPRAGPAGGGVASSRGSRAWRRRLRRRSAPACAARWRSCAPASRRCWGPRVVGLRRARAVGGAARVRRFPADRRDRHELPDRPARQPAAAAGRDRRCGGRHGRRARRVRRACGPRARRRPDLPRVRVLAADAARSRRLPQAHARALGHPGRSDDAAAVRA